MVRRKKTTRSSPPSSSPSSEVDQRSLSGVPILVVEDDAANLKLFALLLRDAGAIVDTAASAEEALRKLLGFNPRIVVIDLTLPRMNGMVLQQVLKADPATRAIVAVAVSSLDNGAAERLALSSGFVAYIRKPVDLLTFAALIAAAASTQD